MLSINALVLVDWLSSLFRRWGTWGPDTGWPMERRSSSPPSSWRPFSLLCFPYLLFLLFHFSCGEKSLLLPSLAYPLYSHHFRPPLPMLGRSFASPEGVHLTIKGTGWAWTGLYIPEMPAWPWNAAEPLRKGPKGPILSQGRSAAPTLHSHILTVFFSSRMFSVSQRIILTLKIALSFNLVLSTTVFARNPYDICHLCS